MATPACPSADPEKPHAVFATLIVSPLGLNVQYKLTSEVEFSAPGSTYGSKLLSTAVIGKPLLPLGAAVQITVIISVAFVPDY
jgi:hypothetical protein